MQRSELIIEFQILGCTISAHNLDSTIMNVITQIALTSKVQQTGHARGNIDCKPRFFCEAWPDATLENRRDRMLIMQKKKEKIPTSIAGRQATR